MYSLHFRDFIWNSELEIFEFLGSNFSYEKYYRNKIGEKNYAEKTFVYWSSNINRIILVTNLVTGEVENFTACNSIFNAVEAYHRHLEELRELYINEANWDKTSRAVDIVNEVINLKKAWQDVM